MKPFLALAAFSVLLGEVLSAGQPGHAVAVFQPGEELQYKVKWQFIRLGTLTLRTDSDSALPEGRRYRITLSVESNPQLQFVWIRESNVSWMNAVDLSTDSFLGRHRNGEDIVEVRQRYDPQTRTAFCSKKDLNAGTMLYQDTLPNSPRFVDGAALVFAARVLSRSVGEVIIPTMVDGVIHNTILDFGEAIEPLGIGAWDQDIRTRRYSGRAEWTGATAAGLSGEFTGWLSDDDAAVPIRAEMKILLGSVVLELERWTRPGWTPPSGIPAMHAERRTE